MTDKQIYDRLSGINMSIAQKKALIDVIKDIAGNTDSFKYNSNFINIQMSEDNHNTIKIDGIDYPCTYIEGASGAYENWYIVNPELTKELINLVKNNTKAVINIITNEIVEEFKKVNKLEYYAVGYAYCETFITFVFNTNNKRIWYIYVQTKENVVP